MKRKQYIALVVLTVVSGILGGAVTSYLLTANLAIAQTDKKLDYIEAKSIKADVIMSDAIVGSGFLLTGDPGRLELFGEKARIFLGIMGSEERSFPTMTISDSQKNPRLLISDGGISLIDSQRKIRIRISENEGRPSISVRDEDGKAGTVIGCANLKTTATGSVEQRSEASIIILNKEGDVVWQYPR